MVGASADHKRNICDNCQLRLTPKGTHVINTSFAVVKKYVIITALRTSRKGYVLIYQVILKIHKRIKFLLPGHGWKEEGAVKAP